jgi:hypothetical protein
MATNEFVLKGSQVLEVNYNENDVDRELRLIREDSLRQI